jgi:hypothetical protein
VSHNTAVSLGTAWLAITATAVRAVTVTGPATAEGKATAAAKDITSTDITSTDPERARALKQKETRDG